MSETDDGPRVDLGDPFISPGPARRDPSIVWFASGPVIFYGTFALAVLGLALPGYRILLTAAFFLSTATALYLLFGGWSHSPVARFGRLFWNLTPVALPFAIELWMQMAA